MHFGITDDSNRESQVGGFTYDTCGPTEKHFRPKDYGAALQGIGIVLMCRNPALNFKQRIRFSKKHEARGREVFNRLYMDIMLDLEEMKSASPESRRRIILQRILDEVPVVLNRYKFQGFDKARFLQDMNEWFRYENFTWKDWDLKNEPPRQP